MYLGSSAVVKFGVLVGCAASFLAASIAQRLFWENDPYSTFWITRTFRSATSMGSISRR